jgi:hypothetical protein
MLRQRRKEPIVTITLALLLGNFTANKNAKTAFMEQFGPERAQRIALTRDNSGNIQVIFANDGGPQRDGATEIVQATKFLDDNGKQSFLFLMQRRTPKIGQLTDKDMAEVVNFFRIYFEGKKTDVFLAAKSDQDIDGDTETWYAKINGDTITARIIGDLEDFVVTGNVAETVSFQVHESALFCLRPAKIATFN